MPYILLYPLVIVLFCVSYYASKEKTIKALNMAKRDLLRLIPKAFALLSLSAIVLAMLDIETITKLLGADSGFFGVVIALIVGSISVIPAFIAFQIGKTVLDSGAGYMQLAAFISTLIGVGVFSLPIEIEYFGKRFAIMRNLLFLGVAVIFTLISGLVL